MKKKREKKLYGLLFSGPSNPRTAGSLQRSADARLPRSAAQALSLSADLLLVPPLALRLGYARRRLPLGGVQRRRGSPRLGGGVGGSPHLLSPVASRPRLRPPRTGRRPCVRTPSPLPPLLFPWEPGSPPAYAVPVGARPAAQGGRALAPPVLCVVPAYLLPQPLLALIIRLLALIMAQAFKKIQFDHWL